MTAPILTAGYAIAANLTMRSSLTGEPVDLTGADGVVIRYRVDGGIPTEVEASLMDATMGQIQVVFPALGEGDVLVGKIVVTRDGDELQPSSDFRLEVERAI